MTDSSTPPPSLLETMRLEEGTLTRLDRHLARARGTAGHFGYAWRDEDIRAALGNVSTDNPTGVWRVRLLIDPAGHPAVTCTAHVDSDATWRVAFASHPTNSDDARLVYKTTAREPYDIARRGRPDVDDVILWNERGEVTESTIANLVVELDGTRWTPPISSGLLAGVLRAELLDSGALTERVLTRGMVARASRVWLINSLRGWLDATLTR